jgi:hypothetical protein
MLARWRFLPVVKRVERPNRDKAMDVVGAGFLHSVHLTIPMASVGDGRRYFHVIANILTTRKPDVADVPNRCDEGFIVGSEGPLEKPGHGMHAKRHA